MIDIKGNSGPRDSQWAWLVSQILAVLVLATTIINTDGAKFPNPVGTANWAGCDFATFNCDVFLIN